MKITAVIMCSGLSKRMGKNKLLMDFGGNILVDYIINTLTEIDFYRLLAVTSYSEINKYSDRLTDVYKRQTYYCPEIMWVCNIIKYYYKRFFTL